MLRWIITALLTSGVAAAQQDALQPTFRSETQLVQVSVVAQDRDGKPITDLRQDEFQILDNGSGREIRLFISEGVVPRPERPEPSPLMTGGASTLTNQGPARGRFDVILFDNLATEFAYGGASGSGFARQMALRTLKSMPAGDKIAIYALWRKLQIIREFTTDRDSLVRHLTAMGGSVDTPSLNNCSPEMLAGPRDDEQTAAARARVAAECGRIDSVRRTRSIDDELQQVADHLAGIPGRKNLFWVAGEFPISPTALQKLSDAGVAIYPLDVHASSNTVEECDKSRGFEGLRSVAAATGGVAYYCRRDLDVALREAMDDARVNYTLGFYHSSDDSKSGVHRIGVRVTRPGVALRYRTAYVAEPAGQKAPDALADLLQALNRPVDSSAIPVKASVNLTGNLLSLEAALDAQSLDLVQDQNLWKGKIEVLARFTTADGGVAGDILHQTLALNLRDGTRDGALRDGLPWRNTFTVPAKAVELRLLFANPATGKIGTLTIPLVGDEQSSSALSPGTPTAK